MKCDDMISKIACLKDVVIGIFIVCLDLTQNPPLQIF